MPRLPILIAVTLSCLVLPLHAQENAEPHKPGLNKKTFDGLAWRSIGPAFMSGRIADIAIDPANSSIRFIAAGSGGVWKTINAGTTWTPVFDKEDAFSIGCITIDPNDSQTIWVGTGENVSGRHVGFGNGIYRSVDGGANWQNMGLKASDHIGSIRIDPRDSNVILVAAQGPLWSPGGERGVYRSTDGGKNWQNVLAAGPYTGAGEVHLDPGNPDVVYATLWQRHRTVSALLDGGPESAIHKSTDGGITWRKLDKGLPEENMGRIGLAVSPQKPNVIYAAIELTRRKGGFYRSEDGGGTWEKRSDFVASGTGPHYYQEIFASPHQFDLIYHMDVYLHISHDGGKTFIKTRRDAKHVDHHAMAFIADDPDYLMVGNDGGVYESHDLGKTWRFFANLPLTQFYKVSVDYDTPFYNVYGGTQDNSTQGAPSRTRSVSGIRNADWSVILGGDGHQPAADPDDPNTVYAQWQQGYFTRYDRQTGESIFIQPQPAAGEPPERFNWDAPIVISPHNSKRIYVASQRLWRSDDRGETWTPASDDLTRQQNRLDLPIMGRKQSFDNPWDLYAMSKYNTIANISESPITEGLLYAGTDDGLIHVSSDGGQNWRRAGSLPGAPDFYYVNDIKADLHDSNIVYTAVDNHKAGDYRPLLYKSTDQGRSWRSINSGIPPRHLVWRIVQDHVNPQLLFAGTEFGVFFTIDGGGLWVKLGGGLPNIAFRDLVIQKRENDLVGATFGRGIYILDDYTPLRSVTATMLSEAKTLFPVREADWYVPLRPMGCMMPNCPESQGNSYFVAPNPDFGALFNYYLAEPVRSRTQQRQEKEKPLAKAGRDIGFAGWEAVTAETLEDEPAIVLTVRDSDDNIIRHITGPVDAGFHRVAWDLRFPTPDPWQAEPDPEPWEPPGGTLVAPGTYTVTMSQRVDGQLTTIGDARQFEVVSARAPSAPGSTQQVRVAFLHKVDRLERDVAGAVSAIDELTRTTAAIKQSLMRSTAAPALYARTHEIEKQARVLRDQLAGNEARTFMNELAAMPVLDRLYVAGWGDRTSAYGPTPTQRQSLDIAQSAFSDVKSKLHRLMNDQLPALERELDASGVPWTPGRTVSPP